MPGGGWPWQAAAPLTALGESAPGRVGWRRRAHGNSPRASAVTAAATAASARQARNRSARLPASGAARAPRLNAPMTRPTWPTPYRAATTGSKTGDRPTPAPLTSANGVNHGSSRSPAHSWDSQLFTWSTAARSRSRPYPQPWHAIVTSQCQLPRRCHLVMALGGPLRLLRATRHQKVGRSQPRQVPACAVMAAGPFPLPPTVTRAGWTPAGPGSRLAPGRAGGRRLAWIRHAHGDTDGVLEAMGEVERAGSPMTGASTPPPEDPLWRRGSGEP
jgi:hypothetical protein